MVFSGLTNQQLQYIQTQEGIIAKEGTKYVYKYFKTDHLGSTRVLLAARKGDGSRYMMVTEQTTDYYPYGLPHQTNNLHYNNRLFSGKELINPNIGNLGALGLYDFGARHYDPMLGRWFNVDPALQLANPYVYCGNSPVMYSDPNGEFFWTIFSGVKDFLVNTFWKSWSQGFNAWSNSSNWHSTQTSWKIDMGMFKGDFLQIVSRFTWELPQTALGYTSSGVLSAFGGVKSVSYYGGATVVESYQRNWGAFSSGSYINGQRGITADPKNSLFQHEYGHYLQSQSVGLFYLTKYAIPSFLDATFSDPGIHNLHLSEQDANSRALRYFSTYEDGFHPDRDWDFYNNPIKGYDTSQSFYSVTNFLAVHNARDNFRPIDILGGTSIAKGFSHTMSNKIFYRLVK